MRSFQSLFREQRFVEKIINANIFLKNLNQRHSVCLAGVSHIVWPDTALNLADVAFSKQEHTQTALPDTASDALRKASWKQPAVEVELGAGLFAADFQLTVQRLGIYTYTHRRNLERTLKNQMEIPFDWEKIYLCLSLIIICNSPESRIYADGL